MKAVTLVLLWLLGSATAIGVAWSGVGVLDDDLVAPAPAVVNVDGEVGLVSESIGESEVDGSETLTVTTATGDQVSTSTTATTTAGSGTDGTATTSRTATTGTTPTTGTTATTATTSTTGTTATTGSTSATGGTTATTGGSNPQPYETKTFTLVGGATSIKFSPSYTKVLWASPNPGYEVRIDPTSDGVEVEFRSDDHRSRIEAWWDNGPRHEIREDD